MDAAQIDQSLEKLMKELQGFKRSSDLLTDAGIKAQEVVEAAEAIIALAGHIRADNQHQLEAVRDYTATSKQSLSILAASVTNAQNYQHETLTAFEQVMQQKIDALAATVTNAQSQQSETLAAFEQSTRQKFEALAANVISIQKRQEEALAKLEKSIEKEVQEQSRAQRRLIWTLFIFVLITLFVAGTSLWLLLVSAGIV